MARVCAQAQALATISARAALAPVVFAIRIEPALLAGSSLDAALSAVPAGDLVGPALPWERGEPCLLHW